MSWYQDEKELQDDLKRSWVHGFLGGILACVVIALALAMIVNT